MLTKKSEEMACKQSNTSIDLKFCETGSSANLLRHAQRSWKTESRLLYGLEIALDGRP